VKDTRIATWNSPRLQYSDDYLEKYYAYEDADGRRYTFADLTKPKGSTGYFYKLLGCDPPPNGWRMPESRANEWIDAKKIAIPPTGKTPRYKRYVDELKGIVIGDCWTDLPPVNSQAKDALGYPTQKPVALLERIVAASSNLGDIVLDPFCGCGTTIAAAQKLEREGIGIDITHLSVGLQKLRLKDTFQLKAGVDYKVIGQPTDLEGARELASKDRYGFQWWILPLIGAKSHGSEAGKREGKKGSDKGIDGTLNFIDDTTGKAKRIIVQVKSGKVKSGDIRDLNGVLDREGAAIGVFVTLEKASKDMETEAVTSGFYHSDYFMKDYPRLQILTVEDILHGKGIQMPSESVAFKKAEKEGFSHKVQRDLFGEPIPDSEIDV